MAKVNLSEAVRSDGNDHLIIDEETIRGVVNFLNSTPNYQRRLLLLQRLGEVIVCQSAATWQITLKKLCR